MGFLDNIIGFTAVIILVYFIYRKMADKNPSISEAMSKFNPRNKIESMELPRGINSIRNSSQIM